MVQQTENGSLSYRRLTTILISVVIAISGWAFALYRDSVKADVLTVIEQKYVSRELYEMKALMFEQKLKSIENKIDLLLEQKVK